MAWQKTNALGSMAPGREAYHDAATGRYAIIQFMEAPVGRGEEEEWYAVETCVWQVDAQGREVTQNGRRVRPSNKRYSTRYDKLGSGPGGLQRFDEQILQDTLKRLDARREALKVRGRYPKVENTPLP